MFTINLLSLLHCQHFLVSLQTSQVAFFDFGIQHFPAEFTDFPGRIQHSFRLSLWTSQVRIKLWISFSFSLSSCRSSHRSFLSESFSVRKEKRILTGCSLGAFFLDSACRMVEPEQIERNISRHDDMLYRMVPSIWLLDKEQQPSMQFCLNFGTLQKQKTVLPESWCMHMQKTGAHFAVADVHQTCTFCCAPETSNQPISRYKPEIIRTN